MNRITGNAVTLLLSAALGSMIFAGTVESPFEVGTWGNFCKGAVSHTFDDYPQECQNLVTTGRTVFNDAKLPMTLFVIVNKCNSSTWSALKPMVAEGHEVGSHGNHGNPDNNFNTKSTIESNIPGYKCVSWAYPYCTDVSGTLSYYVAARDCDGSPNPTTPKAFDNIEAQMFDDAQQYGAQKGVAAMNTLADKAASQTGWSVYLHHGIDGSHSMSTSSSDLKTHLAYLNQNRSTIWCETFGNVARYIKERDAASLKVINTSTSEITVSLTDNLPDSIYNYPLTMRRPLPDGWTTAAVLQKDKPVDDSIVTVNSKKYIMFKAVPDGGDIVIKSDGVSTSRLVSNVSHVSTIVLNKKSLTINTDGFSGSAISVELFNLRGEIIARYSSKNRTTPFLVSLDGLANTAFLVKITDGKTTVVSRCLAKM